MEWFKIDTHFPPTILCHLSFAFFTQKHANQDFSDGIVVKTAVPLQREQVHHP